MKNLVVPSNRAGGSAVASSEAGRCSRTLWINETKNIKLSSRKTREEEEEKLTKEKPWMKCITELSDSTTT